MTPLSTRLVTLIDGTSWASVFPEPGFQLHSFVAGLPDGRQVETIHTPDFAATAGREPPDRRYGNPVLFPAVGVSNGSQPDSWDHAGRVLTMPPHGWARNVYWQVEQLEANKVTAVVVPNPGFGLAFPFDFQLRMTYGLADGVLSLDTVLQNVGVAPFPYALGFHPYLRAPLGPGGTSQTCRVAAPAGVRLTSPDGWRTVKRAASPGRVLSLDDADLMGSIVLADTGARGLEVHDPASQLATRVSTEGSEQSFPVWVIWNASAKVPYVCLEPWTDMPNALNRVGTRTIDPGDTHRYRMSVSVRTL